MPTVSLFPETIVRSDGFGPAVELCHETGKLLVLTLGITRILEQETLEVFVNGSANGVAWAARPLAKFTPKSYCGFYSVLLNLAAHDEVRYLRIEWKASRWKTSVAAPLFGFYVEVEESGGRMGIAPSMRVRTAVA